MKLQLIFFLVLSTGIFTGLFAQDCAGLAFGNNTGRYFLMTYDSEADRNAALANITSITIDGVTYNVGPHPTGSRTIRTTPARPNGTFSDLFTGTVTLNPSGETCDYSANALPISLVYINAQIENSTVVIKWETAQEVNNERFEIQKSTDGRNFETFTWIAGSGSTNESQNYEIRHSDYTKGVNYYRLKQIDHDGVFEFSPIVAVNAQSGIWTRLGKNIVVQGEEVIILNAMEENFEIFDYSGNKMSSGFIGAQNQSLSTIGFVTGMYFIRTGGGSVLKFVVK